MTSIAHAPGLDAMSKNFVSDRLARRKSRHIKERVIEFILFLAASVSVATTIGIVLVLLKEAYDFFQHVSLWDFLTDTQWRHPFSDAISVNLVYSPHTLEKSALALLVAIP